MRLKSLFARNVALLFAIILASQLVMAVSVATFILRPQTQRATLIVADMIADLSTSLAEVPVERRPAVIERFGQREAVSILPAEEEPQSNGGPPGLLERYYMHTLVDRLERQREIAWRTDSSGRLWLHLDLGGEYYWLSLSNPRVAPPMATLMTVLVMTVLMALAAGYVFQQRLSAPLARLATAADRFGLEREHKLLDEDGPTEIARVAGSFNRMQARLKAHERERSVMLAGISHDLRTPLAKLSLALEMLDCDDQELHAGAVRQVERIDEMLGQFFEFARGFEEEAMASRDLGDIVREALEMAGETRDVAFDPTRPVFASVRPVALARAVANLVANAQRHGATPIEVSIADDTGGAVIEVSDGGKGFDLGRHGELVEPFARGDQARSGSGSGLGLAIAQRAVASFGGEIEFRRGGGRFRARILLPSKGLYPASNTPSL